MSEREKINASYGEFGDFNTKKMCTIVTLHEPVTLKAGDEIEVEREVNNGSKYEVYINRR